MTRLTRFLFIIVPAALIIMAAGFFIFRNLGSWLTVCDPAPESLDILFTFGGDPDRYIYGKKLFARYDKAIWVVSVGYFPVFDTITLADIARENAALASLDTSRMIINDTCHSTGAEIDILLGLITIALSGDTAAPVNLSPGWEAEKRKFARYFAQRRPQSLHIGLVSHPYHMRRIKLLFSREMHGQPVRVSFLPVPYSNDACAYFRNRHWWRYETDASFVISEMIKIFYYYTVRGRVTVHE